LQKNLLIDSTRESCGVRRPDQQQEIGLRRHR